MRLIGAVTMRLSVAATSARPMSPRSLRVSIVRPVCAGRIVRFAGVKFTFASCAGRLTATRTRSTMRCTARRE